MKTIEWSPGKDTTKETGEQTDRFTEKKQQQRSYWLLLNEFKEGKNVYYNSLTSIKTECPSLVTTLYRVPL